MKRQPIVPAISQTSLTGDAVDDFTSTYRNSYNGYSAPVRAPIRPTSGYEWFDPSRKSIMRSTSQDAFVGVPAGLIKMSQAKAAQHSKHVKPLKRWSSTPHVNPISTTAGRSYVAHPNVQRPKVVYESQPVFGGSSDSRLFLTPRSTTADAFRGVAAHPARPCFPQSLGSRVFESDIEPTWQTTSRTSFMAHSVKAYVQAAKPQGPGIL